MTQGTPEKSQDAKKFSPIDVILERAGLENINDVPSGLEFHWGKQGVWKASTPVPLPGFEWLTVFALFQSPDEIRVYATPNPEAKPAYDTFVKTLASPASAPEFAAHRFTLCKTAAPYFVEVIRDPDVLMTEVAAELRSMYIATISALTEDVDVDEEEEEGDGPNGSGS